MKLPSTDDSLLVQPSFLGVSLSEKKQAVNGKETGSIDGNLPTVAAENTATLPSSWFRSDKMCELEKRAIYSKSWFMATVTSHFTKPGDYQVFEFAGYSIFLILDKDGKTINGFHNVCRHRAYPVRTKQSGCSTIIGCGYHAWSYNTKGELIKAPSFDTVPGFDKTKNSLFPIHVHVTRSGCIFVNLEAGEKPSISFEEYYPGLEETLDGYDFKKYELYHQFDVVGDFNWKTRIDGYQECYHCTVAHPSLAKAFDTNYTVQNVGRYTRHLAKPSATNPDKGALDNDDAVFLYLYPSGALNCFKSGWSRSFTSPVSGGKTRVCGQTYLDPSLTKEEKDEFVTSFTQIFKEDFALCVEAQKSLKAGVYTRGVLHPLRESGVLHYQALTRKLVLEHAALEENAGHKINPAAFSVTEGADAADELCRKLEQLAW